MTYLEGDLVLPSVLILPPGTAQVKSGSIAKSGSAVVYISGSKVWQIEMTEL